MKKTLNLLILLLLTINIIACKQDSEEIKMDFTDASGQTCTYRETFFDDFSEESIDENKWTIRDEQLEWLAEGEQERLINWYKKEAVKVEDGKLIITDYKGEDKLVSGAITTKGKFEQSHGLFEIKFKCDYSSGLWYAFWLMDENNDKYHIDGKASDAAEIDIFEIMPHTWMEPNTNYFKTAINYDAYDYDAEGKVYPNDFYPDLEHHPALFSAQAPDVDDSFYDDWHTVFFLWGDENYELYLDGKLQYVMKGEDFAGMCQGTNHIIISSEIREESWAKSLDENLLPAKFYVDYVKAYLKE